MQNNTPREVWFVRHGESVANAGGITQEASSYPLSELGFRQAHQFAASLLVEPDLIIYSTYARARQTAEPTIHRFPNVPTLEWPVQEVQYLDPTLCVGTTQDERRSMSRIYWERSEPDFAAPGAESFAGFIDRVQSAMEQLGRRHERSILVFSHGQFMSAIAWLAFARPAVIDEHAMRRFYQFIHGYTVPNCAIMPFFLHHDGRHSLGGLHVPNGIEPEGMLAATGGLAGI